MNQLSSIQKSIWMAQSRSPLSPLFNIGGYVKLFGLTDEAHFLQTFRLITRQMDVLSQTSGQLEDLAMDSNKGGDSLEEIICLIDCSARSNPLRYVMNLVDEDIRIPFAQSDLLFKGILFKLSDLEYLWYVKAHHLVTDGFSMGLLFRKVMAVYNAPLLNVPSVSVNNIFPYSAFVADEQKYQSSDQYDEDEKFWHERLSKVVGNKLFGSCLLPVSQKSMKAGRFEAGITRNLFKKVEAYCSQFNCSVPHFYITLLLAISKAYNNAPGVLGIPVFNRLSRNSKNTFGPFVNMVPLYCQLDDQLSFVENMKLVKDELNQCFRHKRYPLIDILEKLEQHENIYNVTFSYQKIDYLSSVNDNPNEVVFLSGSEQQEDMIFHLLDFSEGGDLVLAVDYLIGSFSLEVIQGIVAAILRMTENLVTLPDLPLRETGYIGDEERKKLLYDFNQTERHYEGHTLVAELFEQAAKQHPAATALVFREKQFSYSEINSQANRMAHYLRNTHNVSREVPVAIILDRDEWMVIAMIAVLKSGGYYIPIHPETPETRIAYILDDAGCQQQIDGEFLSKFSLIADGYSAQNPDHINQSNDLNCLIYTSGSTGLPKGAMLENSGIVNQIFSKIDLLGFKEGEVLCHNSHLHFVGGIWQLWAPLVLGGKVVLCDDDELTDIRQVVNKAEAFKSRVIEVIPSQLNEHLNDESGLSFAKLEILVLTGERLNMENVRRCYRTNDRLCIMNGYGQTESSNDTACHILNKQTTGDVILIGRPIANTRHYILNESLGLVPIGVTGELYTSGAGLSRGYLNRPDLTAEKFIQNPYLKGGRMYRTGDLVRWLPSGDIEFIGRKDEQVKIRGYRIEPGEVKDVLLQHPKVEEAVILARGTEGENNELVAYFVSESGVDGGELRSYLRDRLPSYMVPVHYVQLESMPLLSNGKIDKHSLPAPSYGDIGTAYVKPSTATESMLASLWSSLLGVAEDLVGRDDDFFELGGHSLKAVRLLSRIQAEFSVVVSLSELFGNPRISDLAVLIDSKQAKAVVPIRTIPESDSYALSSAQRRLWVLCQFPESSMAYNQVSGYLLKGHLDVTGLEESFNKVIARHEILRTVIREDETGMPRQYVLSVSSGGLKLKQTDLRGFASKGVEDLKPLITSEFRRAFDLSTGPLVRADLYRLSADEWLLTYSMHHIISDGWSMGLLIREVLMFYKQYLGGRSDLLPPSPGIQYKDYASWQLERLQSGILGEDKSYWLSQFGEGVPVLELPTDRVRSSVKTYNGGNVVRELGAELTSGITAICRAHSATLFMGLLAGVNALLYRYTGQTDITIGSPTAGRDHGDLEDQLGFYVNTLALRTRFSGSENYGQLLNLIREVTLSAYDHQSYPFDELVEALDIRRDLSRSPLFDVMVVLQNNDQIAISDEGLPDLEINPVLDAEQPGSKFDLTFTFTEAGEGLVLVLEFNSDLYDQATAERMGAHLEQLLDALVSSPDTGISSVEYLTADQRHTLLEEFNNTSVAYPEDKTVIDLFKEQVELHRDKTAVVSGSKSLTYQELDERSDLLAKYLISAIGVLPGERVGIFLDKGLWHIITIIGILKSGGAYVPIDPDYPQERIDYIISDSNCKTVIDVPFFNSFLKARRVTALLPHVRPESSAYVIYTSGSTGRPKGVLVGHNGVFNLVVSQQREFGLNASENILQLSNLVFDASVEQIFIALSSGASLHLISKDTLLNIPELEAYISGKSITHIHTVPAILQLLTVKKYPWLKRVISGGDVCPRSLAEDWAKYHTFYNEYGPTETTVTSIELLFNANVSYQSLPIGKPIANTQVYILDNAGQLCPIGVSGEICIGGAGIARGYLNNPELTASRFVSNPFKTDHVIYRTGDIGRWLANGNIEYLGRNDDQIKINGYRIEPGEVESALLDYPGISAAVVLAIPLKGEEPELRAFITSAEELNGTLLNNYLSQRLPSYMLPRSYSRLARIPLTTNGKVDRKAMVKMSRGELVMVDRIAPRTETERQLSELWSEILGRDISQIGVGSDFFELGANSLKAMRLISQVSKVFGVKIALKKVFTVSVLEEQAKLIDKSLHEGHSAIPSLKPAESYVLSSSQRRLWVLSNFNETKTAYNISGAYWFGGELNFEGLQQSFQAVIERHEVLRTVFRSDESGEVKQYVLPENYHRFVILQKDMRNLDRIALQRQVESDFQWVFDLYSGPLLRACLYWVSEKRWVFSFVMHHIISDGWSMGLLVRELMGMYRSYTGGAKKEIAPLRLQYKDYASWQQARLKDGSLDLNKGYWTEQFRGKLPLLAISGDKPRPAVRTYNGSTLRKRLSPKTKSSLEMLLREENATLFMGLLGAVNVLLFRYTGQQEQIIGTPVAGREHADLEDQIGFYVNTLPLRVLFNSDDNFKALLAHVKRVTLAAYEHQAYPFDELVDHLNLQRDISRNPLFDIMVVLQQPELKESLLDGARKELKMWRYEDALDLTAKFDLQFTFIETSEALDIELTFNTDIYEPSTAGQMLRHLETLIGQVVAAPWTTLGKIDFLDISEKAELLERFNDTTVDYRNNATLTDLFAEQVLLRGEMTAIVFEGRKLSYRELDERSNRLAHYLRSVYGINPGELVGIMLEKSELLIICMLGIMKAGGAYVPIDPAYQQDRIDFILGDSKCKTLLDKDEYEKFENISSEFSKSSIPTAQSSSDLMYVLYTSGSTGRPKGCMLEHRGVLNRLNWMWEHYQFTTEDIILQKTTYTFDVSVWELFLPICWGATMVMCSLEVVSSPYLLSTLIEEAAVTALHFVPSMLKVFTNTLSDSPEMIARLSSLRVLFTSGEELPVSLVHKWYELINVPLHNLYGPTEASIDVTYYPTALTDVRVPIGRPISNTQIFILDMAAQLVPVGVPGEICVAGDGLAKGYLNRRELTEEKFVANPFNAGGRMYRTGDLGRWLPSGDIEFIGRKDEQVKIRGYRIEPGEVKDVLLQHPKVEEAVILARGTEGENNELVAYFVSESGVDGGELRSYLRDRLPSYMVPVHYVQLESMPLLSNGKIDKHSLPAPSYGDIGTAYVKPSTATESMLASLWSSLLGVAEDLVGRDDDFFELGGHSLKAVRLLSRIQAEFSVVVSLSELFGNPRISDLAVLIDSKQAKAVVPIRTIPESDSYALSSAQRRLWVLCQFPESSMAYNQVSGYLLKGHLDVTGLEESFNKVIARHEILRTVIREDETGMPRQYVLSVSSGGLKLKQTDLRGFASKGVEDLKPLITSEFRRAFDLSTGPLVRADLYRLSADEWLLTYSMHHIISDGWSMGLLIREVLMFYKQYLGGRSDLLPPSPGIQYKDYASWQLERLQSGILGEDKSYWLSQFGEGVPVLELPTDRVRSSVKTYNGGNVVRELGAELTSGITAICRAHSATLFMGLLAGVNALLYRYTGQTDITIGSPTAGRDHGDLEDQLGFYVNTLALRTRFSGSENYGQLLNLIREVTLSAYDHQSYPFDELVEALDIRRDLSRSPLFDVMVVLQNNDQIAISDEGLPDLEINPVLDAEQPGSKFDLTFTFTEAGEGLVLVLEFNSDLYDQATAERMGAHLEQLLDALVSSPDTGISSVEYLTADQRHTLLEEFNNTSVAYPEDKTVIDLFKEQVELHRDKTAVVSGSKSLTYQELDERSDLLAKYLVLNLNLKPGDRVGMLLERSEWMVVTMIGIMKANCAYVPIDKSMPLQRITFMISASSLHLLICDETPSDQHKDTLKVISTTELEAYKDDRKAPKPKVILDDVSFLIYTSGSTGNPKAVLQTHRTLYNLILWDINSIRMQQQGRHLQFSSFSFDSSIHDVFYALSTGGQIHIISEELRKDMFKLKDYIIKERISTLSMPYAALKVVFSEFDGEEFQGHQINEVISTGEQLYISGGMRRFLAINPDVELYNFYGPSETHVVTGVSYRYNRAEIPEKASIGKPVDNTYILILDERMQLVPIGVHGEIYIGGWNLAKGYDDNPELTSEKFIDDPFRPGLKIYKSGDIGKWHPDGTIEYLLRRDNQVKIRGYRVETGEVESAIRGYNLLEEAVVVVKENSLGDKELVAYFVSRHKIDRQELHSYLSERLPSYMLPVYYLQLDRIPLTSNGKINKQVLPVPGQADLLSSAEFVAPRNEVEAKLVEIWSDVLGISIDAIGVHDDFFSLGGHSLKATYAISRIRKTFSIAVSLAEFFMYPTVEGIGHIVQARGWLAQSSKVVTRKNLYEL